MLTPDVEKYLDKQFENELTSKEIVEDLVSGGWRKSDAQTVVRQYETRQTLEDAPPPPPSDDVKSKKKSTGKIDFSALDSHGDIPEVQSKKSKSNPPNIKVEHKRKTQSVEEQKIKAEEAKKTKTDALMSARVDADASYDDFLPAFEAGETKGGKEKADPYKESVTSFSPLDAKPKKKVKKKVSSKTSVTLKPRRAPGKGRVIFTLVFLWILLISIVGFLYFTFLHSPAEDTIQEPVSVERITPDVSEPVPDSGVRQIGEQGITLKTTCDTDMDCFIERSSTCLSYESVEKVKISTFFSSRKRIATLLEINQSSTGECLLQAEILSVDTDFTSDIPQETIDNINQKDASLVGVQGQCILQIGDITDFLEKMKDNSLSDLDYLSANCSGPLYEDVEIDF